MKNLFNKLKSFYTEFAKKKETYKRNEIRPNRNWLFIVVINLTVFCLLAVFAFYLYVQIENNKLFSSSKNTALNNAQINVDFLKKTVENFNLRAEQTSNIRIKGAGFPDPSL